MIIEVRRRWLFMTATAETVRKLNSLKEQDFTIVINLIDRLSQSEGNDIPDGVRRFRELRKRTSQSPMTEEEVEEEVKAARRELYGHSD